jgi:hypothetical protein
MSQIKKLPTGYTSIQVVGITEGGGLRPSIYFSDGGHFTQSHKTKTNIGHHPPPANGHTFFGNVDSADLNTVWDQITRNPLYPTQRACEAKFAEHLESFAGQGNQNPVVRKPNGGVATAGKVLVEVMAGSRDTYTHESRSPLKSVTITEATKLLMEIRSRSESIEGPESTKKEYYFV